MQCMFKSFGFELVMSISNRKMNNTCSCLTTILCEIEKDFFSGVFAVIVKNYYECARMKNCYIPQSTHEENCMYVFIT